MTAAAECMMVHARIQDLVPQISAFLPRPRCAVLAVHPETWRSACYQTVLFFLKVATLASSSFSYAAAPADSTRMLSAAARTLQAAAAPPTSPL